MEFKRDKFKSLVHYICHRADVNKLGATKLNKILWYVDSINYVNNGVPVTGETYNKEKYGPVSAHILAVLDELEECEHIKREQSPYHGYEKKDYNSIKEPDTSLMDQEEIELTNNIIDIICDNYTATSISERTHDRIWEIAELGEEIPLCTTLSSKIREPSEAARKWAIGVLNQ